MSHEHHSAAAPPEPEPSGPHRPGLFELARAWVAIGSQSFGGGPSTMLMMRSLLIEKRRWVDTRTFLECWSIGQASPGIHLIALAGLLGQQMRGHRGMVISVVAMVLPAAIITALFTAGVVEIERFPLVQWMLRGIIPATGGMTIALAVFFGRSAARRGRAAAFDWAVVVAAGVVAGTTHAPIVLILAAAALLGAASETVLAVSARRIEK